MLTQSIQPPPPEWLTQDLDRLRKIYPNDVFEALMKHTAIDPKTHKVVPANETNRSFPHKYVPRIRCGDCTGKGKHTAILRSFWAVFARLSNSFPAVVPISLICFELLQTHG